MSPFALPSTVASFWIESSVQMIRSSTTFWGQILATAPAGAAARTMARTSTASPWWMAPQATRETPPPFDPAAWTAMWTPAATPQRPTNDVAGLWAAWTPWLQPSAPAASSPFNPMEFWQQAWLRSLPQVASMWSPMTAATTTPVAAPWQPVATAYRSANGHAMAAVLRTIADVVEPKSRQADFMPFWPGMIGTTRH